MSIRSNTVIAKPGLRCAVGLDVGGTQTRWALVTLSGELLAEGVAAGFSGARLHVSAERDAVNDHLNAIAAQISAAIQHGVLVGVHAGVTGIGNSASQLVPMIATAFALPTEQAVVTSDVELSYRAALAPGEGYLIYSGTGSIAAFIDEENMFHRAGGRGVMLDDAGGAYWIAREALRRIWRREDAQTGAWHESPMARSLFAAVGGDSSSLSARYLTENSRGDVGKLALLVAKHVHEDALSWEVLSDAGVELARLAHAMTGRYGQRKIIVAGRASQLHPVIESAMRQAMPTNAFIEFRQVKGHVAAARMAAGRQRAAT